MPYAAGGQEQLQNREEIWEDFPENWDHAPEWCTLTPSESLREWKQVLEQLHDIEPDLVAQWCDLVAMNDGLGHVEATKILNQFLKDAKPDKTYPIRNPSGYMRKNLEESRATVTKLLAAPGGLPPRLEEALTKLQSWKQHTPMSPSSPAIAAQALDLSGQAARAAQAVPGAKPVDPAWAAYTARPQQTTNAWATHPSSSGGWSRSGGWWGQHSWGSSWDSGAASSSSSTWTGTGRVAAPAAPVPKCSGKGGSI
jgi:hypothetical protein